MAECEGEPEECKDDCINVRKRDIVDIIISERSIPENWKTWMEPRDCRKKGN